MLVSPRDPMLNGPVLFACACHDMLGRLVTLYVSDMTCETITLACLRRYTLGGANTSGAVLVPLLLHNPKLISTNSACEVNMC